MKATSSLHVLALRCSCGTESILSLSSALNHCAESAFNLVQILVEDGHLPMAEVARTCKAKQLGLHSTARLSADEALLWSAACAAMAHASESASWQDALEDVAPEGALAWREILTLHVGASPYCKDAPSECPVESLFIARHLLSGARACLDFSDASNRSGSLPLACTLLQASLPLACASAARLHAAACCSAARLLIHLRLDLLAPR
jgi:hypothetical protein